MEIKIAEILTKSVIHEAVKSTTNILSVISDEIRQLINNGLEDYLQKQNTYYSNTKTILHGATAIPFYDFYYPLRIKQKISVRYTIKTHTVSDVFHRDNFITLIGEAGCGKSTLVKHLFFNCIKTNFGIPILIELRYLNDLNIDLEKYIDSKIFENKLTQNQQILNRLLKSGKFIFFLDGFDELNHKIRKNVIFDLNSFVNKYHKNKFLLSSRPYTNIEHLPLFQNYIMVSLNHNEIKGFIKKQLKNENEFANKIIESISSTKNEYIKEFLRNPLLLSLYILTFQRNPQIPDSKHIFYRRVIQALYCEHDSLTKLGYVREKLTCLSQESFEKVLQRFSFLSFFDNKFQFDFDYVNIRLNLIKDKLKDIKFNNSDIIHDLKQASFWLEDEGYYSFNHRSIQEFLSALFVQYLPSDLKEKAYSKIISMIREDSITEIENFLSLCKSMDEINYNKFFFLPILTELNDMINTKDAKSIIKSILPLFRRVISRKYDVYYDSFLVHPYLRVPDISDYKLVDNIQSKLEEEFTNISNKRILKKHWQIKSQFSHDVKEYFSKDIQLKINLFEEMPSELVDYFKKKEDILKSFRLFAKIVRISHEKINAYVEDEHYGDSNFIDMI